MTAPRIGKIDHIAIAVKDLDEALQFYTDVLGLPVVHEEVVAEQGIRVAFVDAGSTRIELMEPIDSDSFVARHISKHGPGLAHICFATDNIDELTEDLRHRELTLLSSTPITGAGKRRVIFLHPKDNSGTLTEFVEEPGDSD